MSNTNKMKNLSIENASIQWRNFKGAEKKYNPAGNRNFVVFLDPGEADALRELGWNVKETKPRDGYDIQNYLPVKVKFGYRPPNIWLITSKNKTKLDEDSVDILDYAELEKVDLVLTPYEYDVNGHTGVAAYLKAMYATIAEDEFADKYDVDNYGGNTDGERDSFRRVDDEDVPF